MIRKGGMALKPFLPQLQTTFIKCLQDNTRAVRSSAALALGKLSALSTRVDPLVGDLITSLQGVLKHAGKSVSSTVRTRVCILLKDLIYHDDDQIRASASSILGIILQYMEDGQISEQLEELLSLVSSSWFARQGSVLAISSMLRHNSFNNLCISNFPVHETSMKVLGRLLLHQIKNEPLNTTAHLETLTSLVSLHGQENPTVVTNNFAIFGPALAECLKNGSTPVRLAGERCALHCFQLTRENIQATQKFIIGLNARQISKFPEHSDDSEDSEDD
ncbi:Protein ILITYHIA [Camellia lanceoleosa]|uniref:Protein ILITYHIA n=1 Tax=Camellia lanceoleosa TaxID=1840588 RepID=A0ACC0HCK8_9ERIC|nr:Protein ILITYHIA [Camellia lanceoleosa]